MRILIFDTETTGLDPAKDAVVELAAVVYDTVLRCVLRQCSTLLDIGDRENEAANVNRIPTAALRSAGESPEVAWERISEMAQDCNCVAAHNADFDQQWVPFANFLLELPWACTCEGIDWPMQTRPGGSLVYLALEHGLGVVDPHRALNDCLLIARLFSRVAELGLDVEQLVRAGCEKRVQVQALVSFDDKDKAKDAGFRWEAATKRWLRTMQLRKAQALPFRWKEVRS